MDIVSEVVYFVRLTIGGLSLRRRFLKDVTERLLSYQKGLICR